jgi:mRNA interferase MazF
MTAGDILVADLNPVVGHEQGGRRPVVVVSNPKYSVIPGLFLAIPLTTTARGLRHHIPVPADSGTGQQRDCYAMTEQIRALSRERIRGRLGAVDATAIDKIKFYLHTFIG